MLEAIRYHRFSFLALFAVIGAMILSIRPIGTPDYAYATVVEQLETDQLPNVTPYRGVRVRAWRLAMHEETPTIRGSTVITGLTPGDVICVTYTDYWPEGLKVLQQVDQEKCEMAGLTPSASTDLSGVLDPNAQARGRRQLL